MEEDDSDIVHRLQQFTCGIGRTAACTDRVLSGLIP